MSTDQYDISSFTFIGTPKVSSYNRRYESKKTTMHDVLDITKTKLSTVLFLMDMGIINKTYQCPTCYNSMDLVQSTSANVSSDSFIWSCRRSVDKKRHQAQRSLRKGSWVADCNLTLEEIVKVVYCWTANFTQQQVYYYVHINNVIIK